MTKKHFPVSVASRHKLAFRKRSIPAVVLALAIPAHASLRGAPDLADLRFEEFAGAFNEHLNTIDLDFRHARDIRPAAEMAIVGQNLLDSARAELGTAPPGLNSNAVFSSN